MNTTVNVILYKSKTLSSDESILEWTWNAHDDTPDIMTILAEFFESIAQNIKGDRDVSGIFSW